MTAYFISGLGADERIFQKLVLPQNVIIKHIHWIEPLKNEPLRDYCRRLSTQITQNDDFILIGLSFGGMVAIELGKIIPPLKTIIISTAATVHEFPLKFKFIRLLRLHKLVPVWLLKLARPFAHWFFGAKTKKEKAMIRSFSEKVSPRYLKWSLNAVLNWNNTQRPANLVHIQGKDDKIFPYTKTRATLVLENGGHLMVYNRAKEISGVLTEIINRINQ